MSATNQAVKQETALKQRMGPVEWMLLLVLAVLWGGSFFFIGVAVKALPPLTIVALRVGLAALTLAAICGIAGISLRFNRGIWLAFLIVGLLNNVVPFALIVWGQSYIAAGLAAILNATTPLFTIVVAHFFTTDERITRQRMLGLGVGFTGVVLMIGLDALADLGINTVAQLAILGASLSYACAGVYGRRFQRAGVPPLATATGQLVASSLVLLPLTLLVDRPWTLSVPGVDVWLALGALALVSTAVAYILYFRILATAGATNVLLVTMLVPVSAIILGAAFLGERLSVGQLAGMAVLATGLVIIDGRIFGAR